MTAAAIQPRVLMVPRRGLSREEAAAVANGEQPAARITIKGHAYVPEARVKRLQAALRHAEAVMTLVAPRSDKKAYLECLDDVRAALSFK